MCFYIAERYARDTSKKIKCVLHSKGNDGKHLTNAAIYGYIKDPNDRHKWLIDPEAAEVVKRIFNMTIEGKGAYQISRTLTDEKITRPSVYIALRDGGKYTPKSAAEPYTWGGRSIQNILDKQEYMGHTVNFKTYKESYRDKKSKERPKDEWVIFENTQEAIIDEETWLTAQKCRKVKRRSNSTGEPNPLTGLMFCECGSKMYNHRGTDKGYHYDSKDCYACNQYSKYPPKCTMHYIKTSTVQAIALDVIKAVSEFVREDETEFVRIIREENEAKHEENIKTRKKQLAESKRRFEELDVIIKRLFEEKVAGSITEKRFEILSRDYENEQIELESRISELETGLEKFEADSLKAEKFIVLVRKYTDFSELTPTMLNEYIDKIVVFEAERINGKRKQRVDVYLNFIGKFAPPIQDNNNGEIEENVDPIERRRETWRNYYHKNREGILAKKAEQTARKKAEKLSAQPLKTAEEIATEEQAKAERKRAYRREYYKKYRAKNRTRQAPPRLYSSK